MYGWREDGSETFIYMEYLHAPTLEQMWDMLESSNRVSVCQELQTMNGYLASLN